MFFIFLLLPLLSIGISTAEWNCHSFINELDTNVALSAVFPEVFIELKVECESSQTEANNPAYQGLKVILLFSLSMTDVIQVIH